MLSGPQLLPKSGQNPKQLVIFLHGYGADGDNLIDIAEVWAQDLPDAAFFAPNGIERWEMGPFGFQWFGLKDFTPFNVRAGLDKAAPVVVKAIKAWLAEYHLSPKDLVLVGFSQGTMMALDIMFHLPGLRAVLGYSGAFYPPPGLPLTKPYPDIFLIHGDSDVVVPYPAFVEAGRQLSLLGVHPRMHTCRALGHSIDMEGVRLGGEFIQNALTSTDPVIYVKQP